VRPARTGAAFRPAFVGSAAVSITASVTAAFFLSDGATKQGASGHALDIIFMVLLDAAGIHTFPTRNASKPAEMDGETRGREA